MQWAGLGDVGTDPGMCDLVSDSLCTLLGHTHYLSAGVEHQSMPE